MQPAVLVPVHDHPSFSASLSFFHAPYCVDLIGCQDPLIVSLFAEVGVSAPHFVCVVAHFHF